MRQRISAALRRLPATAITFTALVVLFDGTSLVVHSSYVRERPLWTAFWVLLGLALLGALVIGRRRWAWWLCLISSIAGLLSPTWGARFRPVYDVIELAFLALLLTPSMRRHASVVTRKRQTQETSRELTPSPKLVSLSISGVWYSSSSWKPVITQLIHSQAGYSLTCSPGSCSRRRYD